MEDVLVEMVNLRQFIVDNQAAISDQRQRLKCLTQQVQDYMTENNVKTIANVSGSYTVSLAVSRRQPPLNLGFIRECLDLYIQSAGAHANALDATAFVTEQRKSNTVTVTRVQVRRNNNNNNSNTKTLITMDHGISDHSPDQHDMHDLHDQYNQHEQHDDDQHELHTTHEFAM